MTTRELVGVVAAIREILGTFGHRQMAGWLAERERVLESAASLAEVKSIVAELHSIVLGMGGLFDLPLAATSKAASDAARARLDDLADRLYDLTRDV
jgi:hypothetical protein